MYVYIYIYIYNDSSKNGALQLGAPNLSIHPDGRQAVAGRISKLVLHLGRCSATKETHRTKQGTKNGDDLRLFGMNLYNSQLIQTQTFLEN